MKKLGSYVDNSPKTWVQTERAAHESWAALVITAPKSAALLHHLVANMGNQNAVVINQKTLSKMLCCNVRTVQRAIEHLVSERWIQVVSLGGAGTVNAYVVNDQVAWGEQRASMPHVSIFSARIIADIDDQSEESLVRSQLRRIGVLYPNENQLPMGEGAPPPSQPSLQDMELDLPTRQNFEDEVREAEKQINARDPKTIDYIEGKADVDNPNQPTPKVKSSLSKGKTKNKPKELKNDE